jgi:hypothetical protein
MAIKEKKIKKLTKQSELNSYFKRAMDDPHTRVEYIRKGRGFQPRQKIGVMIACIDPLDDSKVIIGFSLCHQRWDVFDHTDFGMFAEKDFGKVIAHRRAMKYRDKVEYYVYSEKLEENFKETVYIPYTVHESLVKFIYDSYKYYKDKDFPLWVEGYYPREDDKVEVEPETA